MKILICSFYNNGLGDLAFGDKLAYQLQMQYPDAEIEIITSSTEILNKKAGGAPNLTAYNETKQFKVKKLDEYAANKSKSPPPDIVVVGPTLTTSADTIASIVPKSDTPIILMGEYDFASWQMEDRNAELKEKKFTNITNMPTGLGSDSSGIFIDRNAAKFNKENPREVEEVFTMLPKTKLSLLQDKSPTEYLNSTHITVNYSHNNAERLLNTHALIVCPNQNADLIVMGEKDHKDRNILTEQTAQKLLDKGFSKVLYQDIDGATEVIGQRDTSGPVYRVIHTGTVISDEAVNLRKIGGEFSGATGDQSYSEAIANSSLVLYECQSWKQDFVKGMENLALEVDPSEKLITTMRLLSSQSEPDYEKLGALLNDPAVQQSARLFRDKVIQEKCLNDTISQEFHNVTANLPPRSIWGRISSIWPAASSPPPPKPSSSASSSRSYWSRLSPLGASQSIEKTAEISTNHAQHSEKKLTKSELTTTKNQSSDGDPSKLNFK